MFLDVTEQDAFDWSPIEKWIHVANLDGFRLRALFGLVWFECYLAADNTSGATLFTFIELLAC